MGSQNRQTHQPSPQLSQSTRCFPRESITAPNSASGVTWVPGDELLLTGHRNRLRAPAPFICRGCAQLWVRSNPCQLERGAIPASIHPVPGYRSDPGSRYHSPLCFRIYQPTSLTDFDVIFLYFYCERQNTARLLQRFVSCICPKVALPPHLPGFYQCGRASALQHSSQLLS